MISVCMATCNGQKYIAQQLTSILEQTLPVHEIIISDDSSSDYTVDIIKSFADERIVLLEGQQFRSPIYNFEHALSHASGQFIFLSDQDDVWLPQKVEVMYKLLKEYSLVVSDCYFLGQDLGAYSTAFEYYNSGRGVIKNIIRNTYLGNSMAFRRELFSYIFPFPPDIPMHDMWIGLLADLYGEVYFTEERLSYWRRHETNSVPLPQRIDFSPTRQRIRYRTSLCLNIVKRMLAHRGSKGTREDFMKRIPSEAVVEKGLSHI